MHLIYYMYVLNLIDNKLFTCNYMTLFYMLQ